MRKLVSLLLTVVIVINMFVCFTITTCATSSKTLYCNTTLLQQVGKQKPLLPTCACYALAYSRTMLDNTVHYFHEYNKYGNTEQSAWCMWNWGGYSSLNGGSRAGVFRACYDSINNNRPIIIHVSGSAGQHWVTVVGYQNVTNVNDMTESNLLIIDPGNGYLGYPETLNKYTLHSDYGCRVTYSGSVPLAQGNIGTDFYAYIINTSSWKHLTNIDGNVVISTETGKANQVWKFDLQSDGSYKITNCADGLILEDVNFGTTNGSNVAVYGNNNSSAQRWYITGESAAYEFRAQCGNLVMNVDNGSSKDGTNVNMWTKNNSTAQKFQVWKLNKPGSTYVQCAAGSTYKPTVIQWNATSDTKCYDIKIWNGTYWQGDAYKIIWGVTGTTCDVDLPPGYYEAYVDSRNNFSATMSSNVIKFTVVDAAEPVNIGDNVYGSLLVNEPWINVTNVDNDVKLQDDDNYSLHHVIWNFKRQSDGTYVIYNCADNKVLTVDNSNKNVFVKEYESSDSQKWYIYGRWSGEYYFKPKNSNYVLSVEEDSFELGNNVCISKLNYTSDQKYAIYQVDSSILETEKPTEPDYETGDVDMDGKVSVMDATAIQMHLAQIIVQDEENLSFADTDRDGVVSVMDATQIQMFLAQIIPAL